MRRLMIGGVLAVLMACAGLAWSQSYVPVTPTQLVVNTNDTDFTLVAAPSAGSIHVRALQAQNIGTTNKVTLTLCDGTCATAANIKFKWDLAVATATTAPGVFSLPPCASVPCDWTLTATTALIARVDTGATNNVRVSLTYYVQ